jgi:hypothetical protein
VTALEGWIKVVSNGMVAAPANLVDGWTNKGEFLHVRTIDLAPIFNEARVAQQKISEQEDKNLEEIARALVAAIQATGQLPNPNAAPFAAGGWGDLVQSYTTLTPNTVNPPTQASERGTLQFAFPADGNGGQTSRRIYLQPRLMQYLLNPLNNAFLTPPDGWDATVDSDGVLPVDMEAGALNLYIVSSSKPDLPLAAPANAANVQTAAASYNDSGLLTALSNWQKARTPPGDPMPGVIPVPDVIAQWGAAYTPLANYSTRGEFLHVKVVDLRPLFCRVELTDTAAPENIAGFTVSAAGNGYAPSSTVNVSFGDNILAFTTSSSGEIVINSTPSLSKSTSYNERHGILAGNSIPTGAALFDAAASPNAPT